MRAEFLQQPREQVVHEPQPRHHSEGHKRRDGKVYGRESIVAAGFFYAYAVSLYQKRGGDKKRGCGKNRRDGIIRRARYFKRRKQGLSEKRYHDVYPRHQRVARARRSGFVF